MKVTLRLKKDEETIYEGIHETTTAQQFGEAFSSVWDALHARRMEKATSVGQLMSEISDDVLDDIDGSTITIERL